MVLVLLMIINGIILSLLKMVLIRKIGFMLMVNWKLYKVFCMLLCLWVIVCRLLWVVC